MASCGLPLSSFSSSTRLKSCLLVSAILFGKLITSHMLPISRYAALRFLPPPLASLVRRDAACCSARAAPVLPSLKEITVANCSAASRRGSVGPPTRLGSSPSESAKERPGGGGRNQCSVHRSSILIRLEEGEAQSHRSPATQSSPDRRATAPLVATLSPSYPFSPYLS